MYIIDTHVLLWYLRGADELSSRAREIIDTQEQIFVSIVSFWEIAIKRNIGKLDLDWSITQIEQLCLQKDMTILPISAAHLDTLSDLPKMHADPFDRLIIAQAKSESLIIITRDTIIAQYDIQTAW